MGAGQVNRALLASFYQNAGDTYDDNKTEGAIGVLADQLDSNWGDYAQSLNTGTLSKLGVINVADYKASGSATTTTGSITSGLKALTVASASTYALGQGISIAGAGVAGATLVTAIVAINGLVITTADAASVTVSGAVTQHDDKVAVQTAINALTSGGTLIFPFGTYRMSSTPVFTISNVKVIGFGAKIVTTVGSLAYGLQVTGALSANYAILADIAIGDTTFTLSTANSAFLSAGDYVKITTNQLYHDMSGRTYYKGEMVKVVSVNTGTGVVTIEPNGFILAYTVATFLPIAQKITFIENIWIEGLEIVGSGTDNRQVGIQINTAKDITINRCIIHDVEAGIIEKDCFLSSIYDNHIYNCNRASTGYGVSIEGVSQFVNVYENKMDNNRHSFTTGGGDGVCMYINVHHNKVSYNTNAGLNTHGNARFVTFDNNHVSNSLLGISTYCPHTTIQNNTVVNINQNAIYAIEAGGVNCTVLNNTLERVAAISQDAITITVTSTTYETNDYVIIKNNSINGTSGAAIGVSAGDAKLVDVSGNNVNNVGFSFITIAAGIIIKVNDNILNNSSRSGTSTIYGINITNTVSGVAVATVNGNTIYNVYNGVKIASVPLAIINGNNLNPCTVYWNITASFLRDGGNYPQLYEGTLVWDPASLLNGTGETSPSMTVTGAAVGDFVEVAPPYELQGFSMSAYVYGANLVRIRVQNGTGGTIDLGSGTWRAIVHKKQ